RINQIFYVAGDGSLAIPIAIQPMTGSEKAIDWHRKITAIITELQALNKKIQINFGVSDLFQGSEEFVKEMKRTHPTYNHIFDFVHIMKLLRNRLLEAQAIFPPNHKKGDKSCVCGLCSFGFGMRYLVAEIEATKGSTIFGMNKKVLLSI